jgi:hypothetical protein
LVRALPAGPEAEALLSPPELEADASDAGAGFEELLPLIDIGAGAEAEVLVSPLEVDAAAAGDEDEALLSLIELGADAEVEAFLSAIELELCAKTLDIGKPMRAASVPAANTLLVSVIALFTSLYYAHREFGGEIRSAQIEQERCQ